MNFRNDKLKVSVFLFFFLITPVFAVEQLYYNSDLDGMGDRNDLSGSVGADFTVGPDDVWVDSLGFYDKNEDGLAQSHRVGIWDSSDNLVVEVTVPSGTTAELSDNFRWVSIPSGAVKLNANTQYTIGGEVFSGGDIWKNVLSGYRWPLNEYFVGSNQHYAQWNSSGVWGVPNGTSSWCYGFIYGAANLRNTGSCTNNPPIVTTEQNQVAETGVPKKLTCKVEDDGKPYQEGCDPSNPDSGTSYEHDYFWQKLSGPGDVIFDDELAAEPNAFFTDRGWYEIGVEVWDGPQGEPQAEYGMMGQDSFKVYVFDSSVDRSQLGDWRFEEENGSIANDIAGTNDYALFRTLDVHYPSWADGLEGYWAVEFSASDSSYIEIENQTNSDPNLESLKSGTLALWFKCDPSAAEEGSVISFSVNTVRQDPNFAQTWFTLEGVNDVNNSLWHHVAVSYDALEGEMRLYLNGIEEANQNIRPSVLADQWHDILIGTGGDSFEQSWDGKIDDVQIFSHALSAEEVRNLIACSEFIEAGIRLAPDISGPLDVSDCRVNFFDLTEFASNWMKIVTVDHKADLSGPGDAPDQMIDFYDLDVLVEQWLNCNDPQDSDCSLW